MMRQIGYTACLVPARRGASLRRLVLWAALVIFVTLTGLVGWMYFRNHSPGHLASKASLALEQGDTDRAVAYLQEALRSRGEGDVAAHVRRLLARAYIRGGREDDGRAVATDALTRNPADGEALQLLMDSFTAPAYRKYRVALKPLSAESAADILQAIEANLKLLSALPAAHAGSAKVNIARAELNHLFYVVYDDQVQQAQAAAANARDQASAQRAKERIAALKEPYGERRQAAMWDLSEALRKEPANAVAAGRTAEYHYEARRYDQVLELAGQMLAQNAQTEDLMIIAANAILADSREVKRLQDRFAKAQRFLDEFVSRQPRSPRALVALGQIVLERGDTARAQQIAGRILELGGNDLDARLLQTNCLLRLSQPREALEIVTPLTNKYPNVPQVWHVLGQANSDAGNYQAAEDAYRKALTILPDFVSAQRGLLRTYVREGNTEAAGRLAGQILANDRYYMPAWSVQTEILMRAGQNERAQRQLVDLANDANLPPEARPDLVRLLVANGMGREAEELLATLGPPAGDAASLRLQAEVLAAQGKYSDARRVLADAVAKDPKNLDLRLTYAEILWRDNFLPDARAQYDQAAAAATTSDECLRIGEGYLRLRLAERAAGQARRALELQPRNSRATALLAQAEGLTKSGGGGAAALVETPATVADAVRLAMLALNQKNPAQALALARSGLMHEPNHARLHMIAARALHAMGQPDNAINEILLAIKQQPQDREGYDLLVALWGNRKDAGKGMEYAARLTSFNSVWAAYAGGRLALINGQYDHAIRLFGEALDGITRVNNPIAAKEAIYSGLLSAYAAKNDDAGFQRAVERVAGDRGFAFMAHLSAADYYSEGGRKEQARAQLTALEARKYESLPANWLLAVAQRWLLLGDTERALSLVNQLEPSQKATPETQQFLAGLYQQTGQGELALATRQQLVKSDPANPANWVNLALLQVTQGDFPAAFDNLRRCAELGQTGAYAAADVRVRLYATLGLLQAAQEELKTAAARSQKEDYANALALGEAWAELGKPEEARALLAAIPPYAAEYVPARVNLAALAADADKLDEAVGELQKLVAAAPDLGRSPAALPLFQLLVRQGKTVEATSLALQVRDRFSPGSASWNTWTALAATAARDGHQYPQALTLLAALQATPTPPDTSLDVAYIQLLQDRLPEARAAAERVSDAAPYYLQTTLRLLSTPNADGAGSAAESPNRYANAHPSLVLATLAAAEPAQWKTLLAGPLKTTRMFHGDLEALVAQLPSLPQGRQVLWHLALAQRLGESGWNQATLDVLDRIRKMAPEVAMTAVLRYQALQELRRKAEAAQVREELTRRFATLPSTRLISAMALLADKQYEPALAQIQPLLESESNRADLLTAQAQILEKLGRLEQALAIHRKVREVFAEDVSAANNLAYLLAQAHPQDPASLAEARRQIEWAISKAPKAMPLLDTYGWICLLQKEPEKARTALCRAIPSLRLQPAAHYHLGLAYARTGQPELARLHLQNVAVLADPRDHLPEAALAAEALKNLEAESPTPTLSSETHP